MKQLLLLGTAIFILGGCVQKSSSLTSDADKAFEDLQYFPQYTKPYKENMRSHTTHIRVQKEYDTHYFSPWNYTEPPFTCNEILWPHRSYTYDDSFGENLLPLSQKWFDDMLEKGNYQAYGTLNIKAISLSYLDLRSFPTHKPVFKDPSLPGQGYPFDYLQNSGINANEPLFVSHLSKDKEWAYVFSSYATGWVPLREIAFLEDPIVQQYQDARHIELIKDGYSIEDLDGNFVFKSRVGMRLPLIEIKKDYFIVLAILGGKEQEALYTQVKIPMDQGQEDLLQLNADNFEMIMDELLKSKYGWGGMNEERDCSSTLRDLYAAFGIWLPRNSSQQAKIGKVISFDGLSLEEKQQKIREEAIPFETLLYKKGHILLYLGIYEDRIAVLHNAWGVKTINRRGEEGRKIIGKTVISSLEIGKELRNYDAEKGLLASLVSMNIITQE